MKKRVLALLMCVTVVAGIFTGCSFEKTCKYDGCEETELYQEDYCKYHYAIVVGDNILKDWVNGN